MMGKNNKYERILLVATDLMSKKGFNGVSLQQVADKTGLHKSSIFYYFKNKQELFLRILERAFDEIYRNFEDIIRDNNLRASEKLKKAIDNHLTFVTDYPANTNIFLNEFRYLSAKKHRTQFLTKIRAYEEAFERIIVEMKGEGYFYKLDPKIVTFGILGMLNWVHRWYSSNESLTIEEISNMFYLMLTKEK